MLILKIAIFCEGINLHYSKVERAKLVLGTLCYQDKLKFLDSAKM